MTKILLVSGDDDYAAMTFEQSNISVKEAYELAVEAGGRYETEIDETSVNFRAYEFGEIDPDFITFIGDNIQDYDHTKSTDFYTVPKEGR